MAIPETQLETWSHQGAITTAAATHNSLKAALSLPGSPLLGKNVDFYLQGSYKNDTNIRGDSDVDLVVQLNETFQFDISRLSLTESQLFHQSYPTDAVYTWSMFRADVLKCLRSYFGNSVSEGDKAIKIAPANNRLPADVVVCLIYRKYRSFSSKPSESYVNGIVFYSQRAGTKVVNFPLLHYNNGVAKHSKSRTNGWYKPTVRMFKNIRGRLEDDRAIVGGSVPSYFLECLLYNVPDNCYGISYQRTFCNVINWLDKNDFSSSLCQNEELALFGNLAEQWTVAPANSFIAASINLWNKWV